MIYSRVIRLALVMRFNFMGRIKKCFVRLKENCRNPLYLAFFFTILYALIVGIVSSFQPDSFCSTKNIDPTITWRAVWHGCLSMNELGDFLAGASAPFAFIWLVAAVFVQSHELQEQRKDLKITREEFKLNRKVLAEQADYIRQQTEILKSQQKERDEAHQTRNFESELELLVSLWMQHQNALTFQYNGTGDFHGVRLKIQSLDQMGSYTEKVRWISTWVTASSLSTQLQNVDDGEVVKACDPGGVSRIYDVLGRLKNAYLELPSETRLVFDSVRILYQKSLFDQFYQTVEDMPTHLYVDTHLHSETILK